MRRHRCIHVPSFCIVTCLVKRVGEDRGGLLRTTKGGWCQHGADQEVMEEFPSPAPCTRDDPPVMANTTSLICSTFSQHCCTRR